MIVSMRVINSEQVVISTKYRIKVVSFEVAAQLFEIMKCAAIKNINKRLYIKALNDIVNS